MQKIYLKKQKKQNHRNKIGPKRYMFSLFSDERLMIH